MSSTVPVQFSHVITSVEGEVADPQPPPAGHGGEEKGGLNVDPVLVSQLVVVLDLAGQTHVAVE